MGILSPILGAAATGALQRTFLMENGTFNLVPRILIVFDAITDEMPEFSSDVTEHPVEDGPEVSDHIQLKNETLTLRGTVSNTPLDLEVAISNLAAGGLSAVTSSQFRSNILNTGLQQAGAVGGAALLGNAASLADGTAGAVDAIARSALLDARARKARFDVVTRRQRYPDMVVQNLRFPRDGATGRQLLFELELKHIRTVSPLQVKIQSVAENVVTSATQESDLGGQAARGVGAETQSSFNKSWLRSLVKAVR